MNSSRFDQFTRITAQTGSRRSALRALAALAATTLVGRSDAAAGTRCYGWGCPCLNDRSCTDGTICCNGICKNPGDCGGTCRPDGAACPHHCTLGDYCTSCCGGFCAAYGGCVGSDNGAPGDSCDITDPSSCGPGLGCCPVRGAWDVNSGVCSESCFPY